jgi:UTP--glucose-1-phosphate uridylyltransferase
MIRKVVIPAAGLGTRLLPATKQQPKEMLPVFVKGLDGQTVLKPLIQLVFERLYELGIREFCFVVGRGKRSIEDQFTLDQDFTEHLRKQTKHDIAGEMEQYYSKVRNSSIVFINQASPSGLGDAVLRASAFTGQDSFIVHAGDDLILSPDGRYFHRMLTTFDAHGADAVFCVQRVRNPRRYGVVEVKRVSSGTYVVRGAEEKPKTPKSKVAIVAVYAFRRTIYDYVEKARHRAHDELELTDAIDELVKDGGKVYAIELGNDETRIDIGTPLSYWNALRAIRRV